MAIVMRESGAWKTVAKKLQQEKISVNNADELPKLLNAEQIKHDEFVRVFELKRQEADQHYNDELSKISAEQERSLLLIRKEYNKKILPIQEEIDAIKKQRSEIEEKSFFRKLFYILEIIKLSQYKKQLGIRHENILSEKKKMVIEHVNLFEKKKSEARKNWNEAILEHQKKLDSLKRRTTVLKDTLESKDYCGAVAELEMVDFLKKLPNTYYVINDVCIKLNKSISLDKEWIQSIQVDHLVIGPSGVFIIEVKNWSKKFASTGSFHDPYNQIKRHNRACYILLKEQYDTKLRNIIACASHLPSKTDEKYIKVMPVEQVIGYILWFKEKIHDNQEVEQIARFFEGKINNAPS